MSASNASPIAITRLERKIKKAKAQGMHSRAEKLEEKLVVGPPHPTPPPASPAIPQKHGTCANHARGHPSPSSCTWAQDGAHRCRCRSPYHVQPWGGPWGGRAPGGRRGVSLRSNRCCTLKRLASTALQRVATPLCSCTHASTTGPRLLSGVCLALSRHRSL